MKVWDMDSRSGGEPGEDLRAVDYGRARDRRRFYLDRGLRKQGRGAGSDLRGLMALPRKEAAVRPESLFGAFPAVVVGGVAARAYAPERQTKDIDFLIDFERFGEATIGLRQRGWQKKLDLVFPNTSLGLRGEAWERDGQLIVVIATDQDWGREPFRTPAFDQIGLRLIPLAFLVLMKLDSARA